MKPHYQDDSFNPITGWILVGLKFGVSVLRLIWHCVINKFVPNFSKINDIRGNRTPYGKRAHVIAEYLSEIQWKNNNETPDKTIYEK